MELSTELLGQSGCLIRTADLVVCVDPYLSNSVQELDSPDLRRLKPIPYKPDTMHDLDWVLITHEHIDHCDPHTLPALSKASPQCQFLGPSPVCHILKGWGIESHRIHLCTEKWVELHQSFRVQAIPAAHPDIRRDEQGNLWAVGYLLEICKKKIYIAGDTGLTEEIVEVLKAVGSLNVGLLPVNEQNFYRNRRGIVGNMSVRDAFKLAEEMGIETVIPVHWDMFEENSVTPEEIQAVYTSMAPNFRLHMDQMFHFDLNRKEGEKTV